jgi:V/A-type H+-transporting ATPase subunit K|tara:strand:+ start:1390 stop:1755 length:366 start_codon:yes stop_codon:yes gene_type:complete
MWRATNITVPKDKIGGKNMKKMSMKLSLRLMLVLMSITMLAQGVLAAANVNADGNYDDWGKYMGAGIALGLAGLGAGISQGSIGSAAVGMLAEDGSKFGPALIFTALPESIVILGALPLFL